MNVKELFEKGENGTLTYDQFKQLASEGKAKFVDLSEGEYVAKNKYSDDLSSKDSQIETLRADIAKRDEDLNGLKTKLANAGSDADKLNQLSNEFANLQSKYDNDTKEYQNRLNAQAYEFAVKDFANTKNFTSNAAKRDFISEMIKKNLSLENGTILGAQDFVNMYSENNKDAFVVENPDSGKDKEDKPQFAASTPGVSAVGADDKNSFHFDFTGVRSMQKDK